MVQNLLQQGAYAGSGGHGKRESEEPPPHPCPQPLREPNSITFYALNRRIQLHTYYIIDVYIRRTSDYNIRFRAKYMHMMFIRPTKLPNWMMQVYFLWDRKRNAFVKGFYKIKTEYKLLHTYIKHTWKLSENSWFNFTGNFGFYIFNLTIMLAQSWFNWHYMIHKLQTSRRVYEQFYTQFNSIVFTINMSMTRPAGSTAWISKSAEYPAY